MKTTIIALALVLLVSPVLAEHAYWHQPHSTNQNPFDPNSLNNPFGRYGNPFSSESPNNSFGKGIPLILIVSLIRSDGMGTNSAQNRHTIRLGIMVIALVLRAQTIQ